MKKLSIVSMAIVLLLASALVLPGTVKAQQREDRKEKVIDDSKKAKEEFIKKDPSMANLFDKSYGYAIFPNVGKGAAGVGGAAGWGTVYEKGTAIGTVHMTQVTVGAQAGGAAYREVIFFESKGAFDRFTNSRFEFSAETSAIAAKAGASADANYRDVVVVFTEEKGGLLVDASIGGQKFDFKKF